MFGGAYFGGRYFGGAYFGKTGLTSPAYYFGERYFGSGYFGPRYFSKQGDSAPHTVSVSSGLSASGTALFGTATLGISNLHTVAVSQGIQASSVVGINVSSIDSTLGDVFDLSAPLQLFATGQATLAASIDLTIGGAPGVGRYFGGGYFGSYYFGTRYFGTDAEFGLSLTGPLLAAGSATFQVSPSQVLTIVPSALAAAGVGALVADFSLGAFTVAITRGVLAAGVASVSADFSKVLSHESPRKVTLAQGARTLKTRQGPRSVKVRRT